MTLGVGVIPFELLSSSTTKDQQAAASKRCRNTPSKEGETTHGWGENRVRQREALQVGHQAVGQEGVDGRDLGRGSWLDWGAKSKREEQFHSAVEQRSCEIFHGSPATKTHPGCACGANQRPCAGHSTSITAIKFRAEMKNYSQSSRSSRDISFFSFLLSFLAAFGGGLDSAACRGWRESREDVCH